MENKETLKKINSIYHELVGTLDKRDISFIAGKDTLRNKMLNIGRASYFKREKLISNGELLYGLSFMANNPVKESDRPYASHVVFSYEQLFKTSPFLYQNYIDLFIQFLENNQSMKYKKMHNILFSDMAEPSYFLIPPELVDNHILYISLVYVRPFSNPDFKLGINLIIANSLVSKEIIYLPTMYDKIIKEKIID